MSVIIDYTKMAGGIYPGIRNIYSDLSTYTHTGTLAQTQTKSVTIPAGHGLTNGSRILIKNYFQAAANNANVKTCTVKINTTAVMGASVASTLTLHREVDVMIVDITNLQRVMPTVSQQGVGTSGTAPLEPTLDLSGSFTISQFITLGDINDTVYDKQFCVSFWYAP